MSNDTFIIDLSNYRDRMGGKVDPGTYRLQIVDVESAQSKTGNPMINLFMQVVGGDFDGTAINDRLVLTENSLFRTVNFMQALGLPTPRKRLQINARQFISRFVMADIVDGEPYNGRVRSEVAGYSRAVKAGDAVADDEADDLLAAAAEVEPTAEVATDETTAEVIDLEEIEL